MLFLKSWLADYINLSDYTDQQISDLLSLNSGECEEINLITDYFDGKVVVGEIRNLYKHPDADTLNVFDVYLGEEFKAKYGNEKVQIVSAAPNARDGLICPVALDGAKLPYVTILGKKMRGLESQGMCCGMSELALETQYSEGLWDLNGLVKSEQLGQSICKVLPEYFPVQTTFEIKYLQDRLASCANYLGLSIEIAKCLQKPELLVGDAKMIYYNHKFCEKTVSKIHPSQTQIQLTDVTNNVDTYTILDIKLKTPYILSHRYQTRMFLTAKNLIGGVVDLSNYLLYDIGQPNHFFSSAKIQNYNWKFERLSLNTKFQGLGLFKNGVLPIDLTVLKDADDNILIVPGITGSQATKSENNETSFLLEVANFDPEMVARNSFAMNYRSDSAKVFASGVNRALIVLLFYKLQEELPNANISHSLLWHGERAFDDSLDWFSVAIDQNYLEDKSITIDLGYIASRLDQRGIDYWEPILLAKLELLGKTKLVTFEQLVTDHSEVNGISKKESTNSIKANFPAIEGLTFDETYSSFRILMPSGFYGNMKSDEDVLFELAKLIGLNNLQSEYLTFSTESKISDYHKTLNDLRSILTKFGFSEVLTRPFLPQKYLLSTLSGTEQIALEALSSQRADEPFLRDSLFAQSLQVISKNIKLGLKDPKIFELARIYTHINISEMDSNSSFLKRGGSKGDGVFAKKIDQGNTMETWTLSATVIGEDPYSLTSLIHQVANKFGLQLEHSIEKDYHKQQNCHFEPKSYYSELSSEASGSVDNYCSLSRIGQTFTYNLAANNESNQLQFVVQLTQVANSFKKIFDLPINKKVWFVNFTFDPELLEYQPYNKFADVSNYPVVTRSYSYLVPKNCHWSQIANIIKVINLDYTKEGFNIELQPTERMSKDELLDILNFEVEFGSYSRTLRNEEIETWSKTLYTKIKEVCGSAEVR